MAKDKKTLIEFDDLSDEAKKALVNLVLDELATVLSPANKADESDEDDAAEDDEDEKEDGDDEEEDGEEEDSEDDEEEDSEDEEDEDGEEESEDDEDGEESEDDDEEESEDDDEEESDDEEGDDDDDEESEDEDDAVSSIQAELDAIPEGLFKQAKTESAAVNPKEMKSELIGYFERRGVDKKDAKAMVDGLSDKDLKSTYADYYARFLDIEGEVHDVDDPYKAKRIVKGKEVTVWCCNGAPMEDGKCIVNPKVKQPADKKKDKGEKKGKKKSKK